MQTEKQLWEDRDSWKRFVDTHIKIDTSNVEEQEEKNEDSNNRHSLEFTCKVYIFKITVQH